MKKRRKEVEKEEELGGWKKEYCETEEEKILVNINSGICKVQVLESRF